ncbi:uncharacterized protein LOC103575582 isoform X2 [Microplitis demolitor]|uniref:uncharacterized protein LOC103575582 isoform X2 n=1 Tax=Microplitis demolitor TaxID=69319 RepID=UPI0006D50461|nr:uncharacterized protein LOC103575582 isoform X2 [Microplitis demolitor]
MSNCNPTDQNKGKIITLLEKTRNFRWQWIEQLGPTISEIFAHYSRLLNYDGKMFEREFDSLYPNLADNFLEKFPTFYAPHIYHNVKECKPASYTESTIITDETTFGVCSITKSPDSSGRTEMVGVSRLERTEASGIGYKDRVAVGWLESIVTAKSGVGTFTAKLSYI